MVVLPLEICDEVHHNVQPGTQWYGKWLQETGGYSAALRSANSVIMSYCKGARISEEGKRGSGVSNSSVGVS